MHEPEVLLTCEHATNHVPAEFAAMFRGKRALLDSHRGYDPGALALSRCMRKRLGVELVASRVSRLLIESNRSLHHKDLFSVVSRELGAKVREGVIRQHYTPHRSAVVERVNEMMRRGKIVVHVGVHSFTPELNGEVRRADVGLLFDPRRRLEGTICGEWQKTLRAALPGMVIRRNYPYKGISDGLTTALRREFPADRYVGIELEVNNKRLVGEGSSESARLCKAIALTLQDTITAVVEGSS